MAILLISSYLQKSLYPRNIYNKCEWFDDDVEPLKGVPLSEDFTTLPAQLDIVKPNEVYITIYEESSIK